MILFGVLTTVLEQGEPPIWPRRSSNILCGSGIVLALYVFMADAINAASGGEQALRHLLPTRFNWPLFVAAWLLMFIPIMDMCHQLATRYR